MKCIDCGREILENEDYIEVDGECVCSDCKGEYSQCEECGDWYRNGDLTETENGDVCETCLDRRYEKCGWCGRWHRRCDMFLTHYDEYVCENCYDDHYTRCNDCDEIWAHDDMEEGSDGEYYCPNCIDGHRHQEGVLGYHDFDGHYAGRYTADEDDRLFMGVELECDDGTFDFDEFYRWTSDGDLIHFEHDGSLSDECGVECITMPCTLKYHQNEMDWEGICKTFTRQGYASHNTECCGLHVHLTRSQLTILQIVKMDIWLNRWLLWRDIARRESIYGGNYNGSKRADIGHAVYGTTRYHGKIAGKYIGKGYNDRYQPLNTCNSRTVEVRIFRGTLCAETILGTLEALHAMVRFTNIIPIKQVYDRNLPLRFVKFMSEHVDEYPHVMPMLDRLLRRRNAKEHTPAEMLGIVAKASEKHNDSGDEQ